MTALNKQALREAAQEEIMLRSASDTSDAWQDEASPEAVLALLDELEKTQAQSSKWCEAFHKAVSVGARYEERIAELESRQVDLRKYDVAEVMLISGFSRDYAEGWCAGNDNAIHEIRAAGIGVKGE
ncbi:TPA: ead/Ea22-like family protein [Escherichia coli]|uniref:ead/Ea22-like family protein n=1 Tax=Escherichia coli TaxID=562 RepID=UPI0015FB8BD3|nr:ead/Ea22-like family protein [Escherichia coli]MCB6152479.1 ead/Ea22-like family protein [Escherichia coli]MCX3733514.1 ead/Ea22-like family protein [Escherichia coli]MDA6496728.1 ead/Ea22-like family protein [Escherichia coli]HCD2549770.1 ead/Ea22-like family protein [Escherichia coli]